MQTFLLIIGWIAFSIAAFRLIAALILYIIMEPFKREFVTFNIGTELIVLGITAAAGYVHYFGGGF